MKKLSFFLLFVFLLTSCKTVTKIYLGVKNPSFKTHNQLNDFLIKKDLKQSSIYYIKSWKNYENLLKTKFSSFPEAYFFNKEGDFVNYKKDSKECNAKVGEFIKSLANFSNFKIDKSKNLKKFEENISNSKNEKFKNSDINVIITWATFVGKVNKNKAFEWIKLLEQAKDKGIKVNYYLVNYDLQDSWELNNDEKKEILDAFKI
jgi:hypothetical protein